MIGKVVGLLVTLVILSSVLYFTVTEVYTEVHEVPMNTINTTIGNATFKYAPAPTVALEPSYNYNKLIPFVLSCIVAFILIFSLKHAHGDIKFKVGNFIELSGEQNRIILFCLVYVIVFLTIS